MHWTKVEFENWGPYVGQHSVDLGPHIYAVQAEHADDPERSNWLGKSWFLAVMSMLITGEKPEACETADSWITDGQSEGKLKGTLDDGTVVERTRKRGKSTQLIVTLPGEKPAKQKRAQELLYSHIGLTDDDLFASCFIEQKQIARLISSDPADRTTIVNGWLELEPVQDAEAYVRGKVSTLIKEETALLAQTGAEPEAGGLEDWPKLAMLEDEHAVLREQSTAKRDQVKGIIDHRTHMMQAAEFERLSDEGKLLRSEVDAFVAPDVEQATANTKQLGQAMSLTDDRKRQLEELTDGSWDSKCPLTCEECPVPDEVNGRRGQFATELETTTAEYEVAYGDWDDANTAVKAAHNANTHQEVRKGRLVQLRTKATPLLASVDYVAEHGAAEDPDALYAELDVLTQQMELNMAHQTQLKSDIADRTDWEKSQAEGKQRRGELAKEIQTHREALAVLGRQGAQRAIAEAALLTIEQGANALLERAEIDLSVAVAWSREGRGLATHCDQCGAVYPASQKVKECGNCRATRGPKLVEKLAITPSDRSGAADDICGLAFQLSASAWLRAQRNAGWSSALIDEPFASLDKANSRAMAQHLHALVRGDYAFQQGFLVAHDSEVMAALPARVLITADATGSRVRVAV